MNYNLYVAPVKNSNLIGIEIQPPISDKAFDGIRAVLCDDFHGPEAPEDAFVEMTRSDAEGTAFVFGRKEEVCDNIDGVASKIGALINPAGLHEITVHLPATESIN